MTTSQQVLSALNVLQTHPDLREYIKNFYGIHGFMYTIETEPELLRLNKKLDEVLDDGWHRGSYDAWYSRRIKWDYHKRTNIKTT